MCVVICMVAYYSDNYSAIRQQLSLSVSTRLSLDLLKIYPPLLQKVFMKCQLNTICIVTNDIEYISNISVISNENAYRQSTLISLEFGLEYERMNLTAN